MAQQQITIVTALIWNENREILIAERKDPINNEVNGKLEFVGGGIEFGEDPETAIIREVKEEAGLDVQVERLFPKILTDIQKNSSGEEVQIIIITYECKIIGGELKSDDPEIGKLIFVKPEEVKNYHGFKNLKQTVDIILKH